MDLKPLDIDSLPPFQRPGHLNGTLAAEKPTGLSLGSFRGDVSIGAFSYANQEAIIYSSFIGRYTSIAHRVMIGPSEHPPNWLSTHMFTGEGKGIFSPCEEFDAIGVIRPYERALKPVTIGNDVWIGYGVVIRTGLTIGDGAIIGAGAIVTKDVEPYTVMGGSPARLIRPRFDDKTIERLQQLRWWDYLLDKAVLSGIDYSDVHGSMSRIEDAIAKGTIRKFDPDVLIYTVENGHVQCHQAENIPKSA